MKETAFGSFKFTVRRLLKLYGCYQNSELSVEHTTSTKNRAFSPWVNVKEESLKI